MKAAVIGVLIYAVLASLALKFRLISLRTAEALLALPCLLVGGWYFAVWHGLKEKGRWDWGLVAMAVGWMGLALWFLISGKSILRSLILWAGLLSIGAGAAAGAMELRRLKQSTSESPPPTTSPPNQPSQP